MSMASTIRCLALPMFKGLPLTLISRGPSRLNSAICHPLSTRHITWNAPGALHAGRGRLGREPVHARGKFSEYGCVQEYAHSDLDVPFAACAHHYLRGEQRIPANLEKVIVAVYSV